MDEDRVLGAGQRFGGKVEEFAGAAVGDAKLQADGKADQIGGTVRNAVGGARDAARDFKGDLQAELHYLRGEVERLMRERVAPAVADVVGTARGYAQQAQTAVEGHAEDVSEKIRERPLLYIGLTAATCFLLGRLTGRVTYVYPPRA